MPLVIPPPSSGAVSSPAASSRLTMSTPLFVRTNSGLTWLSLSSTTLKPSSLSWSLVAADTFADMNALVLFVMGVRFAGRSSIRYAGMSLPFSFSASRSALRDSLSPESDRMLDLNWLRS